jgi:hypothetical protein
MDRFPLKKVLWRDGDVITEDHFKKFEEWVQNLFGINNQYLNTYGLFRNILFQDYYNNDKNISFHHIEASSYRIDIEYFQGVNQLGNVFKIDEKMEFKINIEYSKSDEDGKIIIYLLPKKSTDFDNEEMDRLSDEIETGTRLYYNQFYLSTTNSGNEGIPIIRFSTKGNELDIDQSFIPFGIQINSSNYAIKAHKYFVDEFLRYKRLLRDYIQTQRADHEPIVWTLSSNIFRKIAEYEKLIVSSESRTIDYFLNLENFFNSIHAELHLLIINKRGEFLTQKTKDLIDIFEIPIVKRFEQQIDIRYAFDISMKILDGLIKYMEYLPSGPISEKELPVRNVTLNKIAGWNRHIIEFTEEVEFQQNETIMTVYLRSFSRAEPIHYNVRIGLGDVSPAHLRDNVNVIKPIKDEKHSFQIECPKEAINKSSAKMISLYLPPPMGENVPDLTSNVVITIRS